MTIKLRKNYSTAMFFKMLTLLVTSDQ